MAASIADYFDGKAEQTEYVQALAKQSGHLYRGTMTARRYTFVGVPTSLAFTTGNVNVTDIGGTTYTVPLTASFTDGSSGSAIFPSEEVKIHRTRVGYHSWNIVVEHLTGTLS